MGRDRHAAGESGNRNDGPADAGPRIRPSSERGRRWDLTATPLPGLGSEATCVSGCQRAPSISTPPLPGLQGRSKTKPRHSVVCSVISGLAAHVIDTIQATYTCAAQNAPAALLEKRCHFGGCCEACDVR